MPVRGLRFIISKVQSTCTMNIMAIGKSFKKLKDNPTFPGQLIKFMMHTLMCMRTYSTNRHLC